MQNKEGHVKDKKKITYFNSVDSAYTSTNKAV